MDNASKALIIAGSILIAVALVSLGVYLFSVGSDTAGQTVADMAAMTTAQRNSTLMNYTGTDIRGSQVKSLVSTLVGLEKQDIMTVMIAKSTSDTGTLPSAYSLKGIKSNGSYTIDVLEYDGTDGLISKMLIK